MARSLNLLALAEVLGILPTPLSLALRRRGAALFTGALGGGMGDGLAPRGGGEQRSRDNNGAIWLVNSEVSAVDVMELILPWVGVGGVLPSPASSTPPGVSTLESSLDLSRTSPGLSVVPVPEEGGGKKSMGDTRPLSWN